MAGRGKIEEARLKQLYGEGRTLRSIATAFGVSPQAVSFAIKRFGIKRRQHPLPPRLADRLASLGFPDLAAYFEKRARSTFTTMGEELGIHPISVVKRYSRWVETFAAAAKPELPR